MLLRPKSYSEVLAGIHRYSSADTPLVRHTAYRLSKALSSLRLKKIDERTVPNDKSEIRAFVCIRNEELRLPYFLKYHLEMGVDRIFIIDNCSTDSSSEIAQSFKNVHVYRTPESYLAYASWIEILLNKYAQDSWALVLDCDELFSGPAIGDGKLRTICDYLQKNQFNALWCTVLDMYADAPLKDVCYQAGEDPLLLCPYFDNEFYLEKVRCLDRVRWEMYDAEALIGGVRKRAFDLACWVSKTPLFFYSQQISLNRGSHTLSHARLADISGVLFHFKFFSDFLHRLPEEVAREVRDGLAREYKIMVKKISPEMNLFTSSSILYSGKDQLHALGII